MRITFILPAANMSGGIRVAALYAQKLQQRGHRVTVISAPPRIPPLKERVKRLLRGRGWLPTSHYRMSHLDGLDLDHRVLETDRPVTAADVPDGDVVIATWWETVEWVAALPSSKGAKVHFVQGHETYLGRDLERIKAAYRSPLHKIAISRWLRDILIDEYGHTDPSLVCNSVDTTLFHAPPRGKSSRPTVGFLYHTHPVKGCDAALETLARLRRDVPGLRVVSFGAQAPIERLPLPEWVEFHLSPEQTRIRDLYAACDAWVSSSRSEGFGLTSLEAMACRTPVVSTRVGGSTDLIREGVNGHVVEIDDAAALADRLERILTLPPEGWRAMSDAALATATGYTWDDAVDAFEEALRTAIARTRRGDIPAGELKLEVVA